MGVVTNKADLTKAQINALIERGALPASAALPPPAEPVEKIQPERKPIRKSTRRR